MGKNEAVKFRKIGKVFWWNNNILWSVKYLLSFPFSFLLSESTSFHLLPTAMENLPSFMCACVLSGVPLPVTPCTEATRLPCPWNSLVKNTGVSCHFLLQGIFPTRGLNLHLLHWQVGSLPLSHQESLRKRVPILLNRNWQFFFPFGKESGSKYKNKGLYSPFHN